MNAARTLGLLFATCGIGVLAALLVLDNQPGPCNVDDLTGCSSVGEIAVFASLFLIPIAAVFGLILAIVFVAQLLRSGD